MVGKGSIIFWLWSDLQIESHEQLKKEFYDILNNGFLGVVVGIRATRYEHSDIKVTEALEYISKLASKHNFLIWVFLDPRFASRFLISKTGDSVDNLITTFNRGEHFDGTNPSIGDVKNGKYSVRIEWILKRHSHMLIDVCLHYEPLNIEKVFLFKDKNGKILKNSIKDITDKSRFFVNYNEDYVEIFGDIERKYDGWKVIVYPKFKTNIMDYASPKVQNLFCQFVDEYKKRKIKLDGIAWDEPGYYSEVGRFPVSKYIYSAFKKKYGYDLKEKLYALQLDVDDFSHIKIRNDYYSLLEDFVFNFQKKLWDYAKKKYPNVESGIHQTWHGESGGTEDMVHGSFDLWKGLKSVSGGFTDMGAAERLVDKNEEWYPHFISNMIIGKSLAKFSKTKIAFFNVWGVDYDGSNPKYPPDIMDYWVDLMSVFSNKWLSHAYGYTGVINADRGFGPGYPFHNTWKKFKTLNKRIDRVESITKLIPTEANIAVVFPVESLKAIGNLSGNIIARKIHELIFKLTYEGYSVDVISSEMIKDGKLINNSFYVKNQKYDFMICPYLKVLPLGIDKILKNLIDKKYQLFFDENPPQYDIKGKKVDLKCKTHFNLFKNPEKDLAQFGLKKLIYGPKNAYSTVRKDKNEFIFTLCPREYNLKYSGYLSYSDISLSIDEYDGVTLITTDKKGKIKNYIKINDII